MSEQPHPPTQQSEDTPRIRFAKGEIVRILTALEMVNGSDLDLGIRVLRLEDELADSREQGRRWRRSYEGTQSLLEKTVTLAAEEQVELLDNAVRRWVGGA